MPTPVAARIFCAAAATSGPIPSPGISVIRCTCLLSFPLSPEGTAILGEKICTGNSGPNAAGQLRTTSKRSTPAFRRLLAPPRSPRGDTPRCRVGQGRAGASPQPASLSLVKDQAAATSARSTDPTGRLPSIAFRPRPCLRFLRFSRFLRFFIFSSPFLTPKTSTQNRKNRILRAANAPSIPRHPACPEPLPKEPWNAFGAEGYAIPRPVWWDRHSCLSLADGSPRAVRFVCSS
jgi:hypothetical protein